MGALFSKNDIFLPKPKTATIVGGVSISQSMGCTSGDCSACKPDQDKNQCCAPCQLVIPANVSSSSVTLSRGTGGLYSETTKLIIKPTIPFEVTFNGKTETINILTLYQPSPVRIENVQHDAMLSIGDPSAVNNLVILVPLVSSPNTTDSSKFVGKIAQYAASLVGPVGGTFTPVEAATGADWNLTKLIPVGENSVASGAFYTWNSSSYERNVLFDFPLFRIIGWKKVAGPQYVLMADPSSVNPVDLELIRRLPITPPEKAIHPMGEVSYKNAPPKECTSCPKPSLAALQEMVFEKKGYEGLSAETVTSILIGVAAFIVGLYAISVGLKWALDSYKGSTFERWADALAKQLSKTTAAAPAEPQLS
jgi:hypothetical protein